MNLKQLIDKEPANASRTDAKVLAWLLETVDVPTGQLVTDCAIMAALSPTDAATVFTVLDTVVAGSDPLKPLVRQAYKRLEGDGLDVNHPSTQAMIDTLFDGMPSIAAALKALGVRQQPRYAGVSDWSVPWWTGNEEKRAMVDIAQARA